MCIFVGITAYMIGMGLGIQLAYVLSPSSTLFAGSLPSFVNIWSVYAALTAVHLFASHRALCLLQMSTLNHQRLSMLVRSFVEHWLADSQHVALLTPAKVSMQENIIRNRAQSLHVRVAPSLLELNAQSRAALVDDIDAQRSLLERHYVVFHDERAILYHADATMLDVALSFCEFEILEKQQQQQQRTDQQQQQQRRRLQDSKHEILNMFRQLLLDSKWDINTQLIKQPNKITLI